MPNDICACFGKAYIRALGTGMTTIKNSVKTENPKRKVRQIRKAAHIVAATKRSAIRFLASTGMHTASGRLKPQFR